LLVAEYEALTIVSVPDFATPEKIALIVAVVVADTGGVVTVTAGKNYQP
jgi:hypothetical protein